MKEKWGVDSAELSSCTICVLASPSPVLTAWLDPGGGAVKILLDYGSTRGLKMSRIPFLIGMGKFDTEKDTRGGRLGPKDERADGVKHPNSKWYQKGQ